MAHHRSLAYHPTARSYIGEDDREYSPSNRDAEYGRGDKKPRKRNSVACARCRKRKIKCTGDLNDGNGCEACQTAGTNQSSCFYLRVNSMQLEEMPLQSASEAEWPYSAPTSTAISMNAPRITSDPSQYALTNATMLPSSTAAPLAMQPTSRAQSYNDLSSTPYAPTAHPRPYIPMSYQTGMDSLTSQYGLQPTRRGMSLQMSQAPMTNYSAAELPQQQWTPLSSNTRPLPSNYAFDALSSYHSAAFPYLPSGGLPYQAGPSEMPSVFPGLSPLVSSLPYNNDTSRILPNPMQTSLPSSSASTQESDGGLGPTTHTLSLEKPCESWHLGSTAAGGSVGSATQDNSNPSEPSSSTSSSSPSDTHSTAINGYDNSAFSTHIDSNASASNLPLEGASRRMSNEDQYQTTTSGALAIQQAHGQMSTLSSSYNMHGLHGGFEIQGDSVNTMASHSPYINSQMHSTIHHPQPQYSPSHDVPAVLRSTVDPPSSEHRTISYGTTNRGPRSQRLM